MHVFGAFELEIQPGTPDNPASVRYCQLGAEDAKRLRAQPPRRYTLAQEGNSGCIAPRGEGAIAGSAILTGGKAMTAELEVVVDPSVSGEELLRMPG